MDKKEMKLVMNSVDNARSFVNIVSDYSEDLDLVRGSYIIDAKSIMGILSMDLKEPVVLRVTTSDERFQKIRDDLQGYAV